MYRHSVDTSQVGDAAFYRITSNTCCYYYFAQHEIACAASLRLADATLRDVKFYSEIETKIMKKMASNSQTKPVNLACKSTVRLLPSTPPSPFIIIT